MPGPGLYSKYIKLIVSAGDVVAVTASAIISYRMFFSGESIFFSSRYFELLLYSLLAWLACAALLGTYQVYRVSRIFKILFDAIKVILLYVLLLEATLNITDATQVARQYLTNHYLLILLFVPLWRVLIIVMLKIYRLKGYNYRNVVIAGYGRAATELENFFLKHPEHGYRFLGFFDDKKKSPKVLGEITALHRFAVENEVDEIYCSPFELSKPQLLSLLEFADNNLIRLKFIPEPTGLHFKKLKIDFYDTIPVFIFRSIPLDDIINKTIKRTFDIAFSLFVIVFILSWLLPVLALLIKLDSKGPVFFKQERSGMDNKIFRCWKLRTMYVNEQSNKEQAKRDDTRITKVGRFLRKTSIDELPQFFNVLAGQMSIVGPRPHMLKHTQEYALTVEKFMVRHLIKPGITGLSQIRGFRGDTTEMYQIKGRVKLDIFYVENWSFMLDLKIILFTIMSVIKGDKQAF